MLSIDIGYDISPLSSPKLFGFLLNTFDKTADLLSSLRVEAFERAF